MNVFGVRDFLCINLCSDTLQFCQSQVNNNYGGKKTIEEE